MDDFDNGWDADARLVDDVWVERRPRRSEVAPRLERETVLLPWLAPQIPLPVPYPVVVARDPLRIRHRLIPGSPCTGADPGHGRQVGEFLAQLHRASVEGAVELGVPDAAETHAAAQHTHSRFAELVVPLLDASMRPDGHALLERLSTAPRNPALIHADLGPDHIRVDGASVNGVIDWTDASIGDPATDLAWAVLGASPAFGGAVAAAYGATEAMLRRARDWHLIGPWHEVLHGLDAGQPDLVDSGLAGVQARLTHRDASILQVPPE